MKFISALTFSLSFLSVQAAPRIEKKQAPVPWKLPFSTSGSKILSEDNQVVKHVGSNWPGHNEAMIPEGLQYSSVTDIVSKIRGFGLNTVRLTFAIEMIDDILDNGGDVTLEASINKALGVNATKVLGEILSHNPSFTKDTKRLEVFDAVANELAAQGIYVHLDNHVSKAIWCCGGDDGNAWFGDTYFNVTKWIRAWEHISSHASKKWPSFTSVGLRNEFRKPDGGRGEPYDWYTWYVHTTAAASAVHAAAPHALIYFSGLDYDTKIASIPLGSNLTGTSGTTTAGKSALFTPGDFKFANKIVLELHKYDFEKQQVSCSTFAGQLNSAGYIGLGETSTTVKYKFPIVLSEWGFLQDGVYWNSTAYNKCLIQFMGSTGNSGWMQWPIGGSYYQRTWRGGSFHDDDETWGLLDHQWQAVRSQVTVDNSLTPMIKATLG